jgi:hypothetical protein
MVRLLTASTELVATVIVWPVPMVTSSAEEGTWLGLQTAGFVHIPEPALVRGVA